MDNIEIICRFTNKNEDEIQRILEKEAELLVGSIKQQISNIGVRFSTGRLVNSIKYKVNGPLEVEVYVDENEAPHFNYFEEDTQPHDIVARNGGFLRFPNPDKKYGQDNKDGYAYFKKVHHPGTKGKHSFKNTLDDNRQQIIQRVKSLIEVEPVKFSEENE